MNCPGFQPNAGPAASALLDGDLHQLADAALVDGHEGVVGEDESRILKNLFGLGKVRVRDIMTPRTVIFALPASQTARNVPLWDNGGFGFSDVLDTVNPLHDANSCGAQNST